MIGRRVAEVGEKLTANVSGITDPNGMANATLSYQWLADGTEIDGATANSYRTIPSDDGKLISVRVSFTDDAGCEESVTSSLAYSRLLYGLEAAESNAEVLLTWNLPVGNADISMYRILQHRPELGEPEPLVYVHLTHSRETTYIDTNVEPGVLYVYTVRAVNFLGQVGEAAAPVSVRVPGANSPTIELLIITGAAEVGQTLSVDTSGITDA